MTRRVLRMRAVRAVVPRCESDRARRVVRAPGRLRAHVDHDRFGAQRGQGEAVDGGGAAHEMRRRVERACARGRQAHAPREVAVRIVGVDGALEMRRARPRRRRRPERVREADERRDIAPLRSTRSASIGQGSGRPHRRQRPADEERQHHDADEVAFGEAVAEVLIDVERDQHGVQAEQRHQPIALGARAHASAVSASMFQ